jgi:nucleoside-diphosphate-sugar epimerase
MRLLVLGGTVFVGRHIVDAAREHGHEVTLFNRGRTAPGLFPDLERIVGDRTKDLSALCGRRFDAVIDTSGYQPAVVRKSARALADSVGLYAFVSTISVYAAFTPGMDERTPLAEEAEDDYGPLKARCEREVESALPGRALIVRPCIVAGPYDPSDRFTYWVRRVADGGDMLAPGEPARPVQLIDARDLGDWLVRAIEEAIPGMFNTTGATVGFGDMLEACLAAAGSTPRFVWVPDDFLLEHGVKPFTDLPLWCPAEEAAAFFTVDSSRAIAKGLRFRPLRETARDTLEWDRTWREPRLRAGLDPEREAELLRAWTRVRS